MAKIPVFDAARIIPREADYLDRRRGSRGEIFYDREANTLRLYNGDTLSGTPLAKADLTNVSNATFLAKATAAGVSGGGATSLNASNLTSGTVPVARLGSSGTSSASTYLRGDNSWASIPSVGVATAQTAGIVKPGIGLSVSDDGTLDVTGSISLESISSLTFARGVSVSEFSTDNTFTDNATDTVPTESAIRSYIDKRLGYTHDGTGVANNTTIPAGGLFRYATEEFVNNLVGNFSDLPDATAASLTIDEIYLPAITMLTVTNSGASAYRFDQYGTTDNPTIYAINATTIAFKLTASGHPFLIQTPGGANYNTGLVHVSTTGVVSTGSSAQGKDSGTLYWKIPKTPTLLHCCLIFL
jgi:hypothetical protein